MSLQSAFHWPVREGTEFHAYGQVDRLLPENQNCCYWAISWSSGGVDTHELKLNGSTYNVTVCHAADLSSYISTFLSAGITDVFWPYKVSGVDFLGDTAIRLWGFPVFAGVELPSDTYFRQYDDAVPVQDFIWSCINMEALPVFPVHSDLSSLCLPGHPTLWEDVLIDQYKLRELDNDVFECDRRLQSLRQLKFLYGRDCFVYDILKLFLDPKVFVDTSHQKRGIKAASFNTWLRNFLAEAGDLSPEEASYLVTTVGSELLHAPVSTINAVLRETPVLQTFNQALSMVSSEKRNHFYNLWNHYHTTRALDADTI